MRNATDKELLELDGLAHALEEDRISADEFGRLQEMLRDSGWAREEFVRQTELAVSLEEIAGESVQGADATIVAYPAETERPWRRAALGLAAALVVLAIVVVYPKLARDEAGEVTEVAEASEAGCAVMTRAVDFDLPTAPIPAGPLSVGDGLVELEFYSGASVVVEGPAEMIVRSPSELRLESGKIHVRVPPQAAGFTVETPSFRAVDLGTEFGVWAGRDGGGDEVHVMEGTVEIHAAGRVSPLGARGVYSSAVAGAAASATFAPEIFVDPDELGARLEAGGRLRLADWESFRDGLRQDNRLAIYFPLGDPESREIANAGALGGAAAAGSVVGARWVPGRLPGKAALSFKSSGDRVRVEVPGEYPAITLAAWVQVDGLDRFYNSLFLTDGWRSGNPHWQIEQSGRLILGVKEERGDGQHVFYSPPVFGAATAGRWIHVASTFDTRTGTGIHYIDGVPVGRYDAGGPTGAPIRIGTAELGNWGLPTSTDPRPIRNLNGKIDEFMLFGEALDAAEIHHLFQSRPDPTL
ncbi:hypothetical protein BH23VER1_BH23VER1_10430 [soil metagenome]